MDRFEELQTFVRIAETLSVTRAAEQLAIAPSAVSRRLRDLETRLGAQLLQRTTRRVTLTDAGRGLYRRALRVLGDLDEAEAEAASARAAMAGTLRLTVPMSFGLAVLLDALTEFMALHPEIVIDIDLDDRKVDLIEENFDLAIRVGTLSDSTLVARRLAEVSSVACASPAFLDRHGTPARAADLAALPALCYANTATPTLWRGTGPDGRPVEIRVTPRMVSTSSDALRAAAIAGIGIVCEPSFLVFREIEAGSLVPVLADHRWSPGAVHAVYPPTRHLSARARAFIDFVAARIGPEPFWEECLVSRAAADVTKQ